MEYLINFKSNYIYNNYPYIYILLHINSFIFNSIVYLNKNYFKIN